MTATEKKYMECPQCHGDCEIMVRERLIDEDGSEDIGATPHVEVCQRCNGEGKIEKLKIECRKCGTSFSMVHGTYRCPRCWDDELERKRNDRKSVYEGNYESYDEW
jgi:Zn finger protein HypA/HybF involved in hydrogenase expression